MWVKPPSGYGGGIGTKGSREYVSFFLSYDNGATWLPQGTTSFPVYDVPGPHPLERRRDPKAEAKEDQEK